jgi:MFS family permease
MTAETVEAREQATFAKVARRLIPLLFLGYIVAFLDRVNVGFAKLQMAGDLAFSDAVYGFGAGIFFIGYFLLEVPSNLVLARIGARIWLARIMITWGLISASFMFVGVVQWGPISAAFNCTDAEFTFYVLRFLLGAAEAGFFPGVILYLTYWFPEMRRAQMVALFMTAIAISNALGAPLSGAIMQFMDGLADLRGWQWLFLLEGLPTVAVGVLYIALLPDGPKVVRWLSESEREIVIAHVALDATKAQVAQCHSATDAFTDLRLWALTVIYFCGVVCFYAVNFWMPTIVAELGVSAGDYFAVGLLTMIPYGVAAVTQVFWARNSDRTGERRWHSAGALLLAFVGLIALALIGKSAIASLVALTLVTTGTLCWVVTFWSLPTAFLSGTAAAAGIAWINSFGNLGGYVGPDAIGRIRVATGGDGDAAFYALAAMALLGAVITLVTPLASRLGSPARMA